MTQATLRILFVCMGNICRSPAAHCVFQHLLDQAELSDKLIIDSAGTHGYHVGSPPDARMQSVLRKAGVSVIGSSRQLVREDFYRFDRIFCMDEDNLRFAQGIQPDDGTASLERFADCIADPQINHVPDPYYGDEGFETVLAMVTRGCRNLLEQCQQSLGRS
jgi:protein-tyrosine phosphatase